MNVLLVTGSRKLVDRGTGCFLAYERIINELLANTDLLVAGDARGPDQWAIMANACPFERWSLGGIVFRRYHQYEWSSLKQNNPLVRNRKMVESVRDRHLRYGENVLCVGFIDPDSKTHGTDHTLGLARRAGIWTARYVWRSERFVEES